MKTRPQILTVHSDAMILELIRDTLAPRYTTLIAHNALEAADVLLDERIDLLIIHAVLPVLSGAELIRILRADARFSRMPIIAFPSHTETLLPLDRAQVQAIMPEPFSIDSLARTVADTLEHSKGHGRVDPARQERGRAMDRI